jgi:hypothetical protein
VLPPSPLVVLPPSPLVVLLPRPAEPPALEVFCVALEVAASCEWGA